MSTEASVATPLTDGDWDSLLYRINSGTCTPFIGPGACAGIYDVYEIARQWAALFQYEVTGFLDLPRVCRYISVKHDVMRPKELVRKNFTIKTPDFRAPETLNDPHRVLSELPFPVYITTNYDDLMWQALAARKAKEPRKDFCRWNESIPEEPPSPFGPDTTYKPSAANPVVFHLYGNTDCEESLVVTDDDYLEFLISVSMDQSSKTKRMIPTRIERAMSGSSLLLLGYRLDDWDFRVLFHLLLNYPRSDRMHVAVQIAPSEDASLDKQQEKLKKHLEVYQSYLASYFESKKLTVRVSLQSCQEFVTELKDRWERSPYAIQ